MRRLTICLGVLLVIVILGIVVLAPFVAPYDPATQFRASGHSPPTLPSIWLSEQGFTYPFILNSKSREKAPIYLAFFVEGPKYQCFGLTLDTHLFGVRSAGTQVFLLGTDDLGRDLFSRLIFGIRFSSLIGIAGVIGTFLLAVPVGSLAGYKEGWWDRVIMRVCDVFLSLPGLFLILGVRAIFPMEMSTARMFWLIVFIFTLVGWSSVTRVVRGQVLSLKKRPYVLAACLAGASDWRLIGRHILPFTVNYLTVQATFFLPLFVLGEITLSFLGVGVQEPSVSLGTLLNNAANLQAFRLYQWELVPAAAIFAGLFIFNLIGDKLKTFEKIRGNWW